jgi:preprotein translocase subunit SecA
VAAEAAGPSEGADGDGEVVETVVKSDRDKIGRNDPCWCGSGKKYKKCHGA